MDDAVLKHRCLYIIVPHKSIVSPTDKSVKKNGYPISPFQCVCLNIVLHIPVFSPVQLTMKIKDNELMILNYFNLSSASILSDIFGLQFQIHHLHLL